MATAAWDEYEQWVGASSTLLIGSLAIRKREEATSGVADSRGTDLEYAQEHGADAYPRFRGKLQVITKIQVNGRWDQDGVVQDPATWNTNGWTLRELVEGWPDTEDRAFTLQLVRPTGTVSGTARFERFGIWTRPAPHIHETDALITVPTGVLS